MPSAPRGSFGQMFKQCQKCYKSDVALKTCSKCHRAHYCGPECQRADWLNHKVLCKLNTDTRNKINEKDDASGESGMNLRTTTALLKKWIQVHKPVLQHSAVNALTLQRTPDLCQTQLLNVHVSPNFSSDDQVGKVEIPRCFLLQDAFVSSIADALESMKPTHPDIDMVFTGVAEQSEAIRKRHGVGMVMVAVHVIPLKMVQIIPFGISESLETLHVDREWKSRLISTTAAGRVI